METCPDCGAGLPSPEASATLLPCPRCPVRLVREGSESIPLLEPPTDVVREVVRLPDEFKARYQLQRLLGAGGMGTVYLALDQVSRQLVAIKFLFDMSSFDLLTRFLAEGRLLSRVKHPNVVQVFDVEQLENHAYLVMEFVPGGSLHARMKGGRLPLARVLPLMQDILGGVEALHQVGVIHRDLKPANILLTAEGRAKVADLGNAKDCSQEQTWLTRTGAVLGTPRYMSPEQAGGRTASVHSDVFAAGLVLYEALAGTPANPGRSVGEVLAKAVVAKFSRIQDHVPGIAPDLAAAVHHALEVDPAARPPSAAAFAEELRAVRFRSLSRPRLDYLWPVLLGGVCLGFIFGARWWRFERPGPPQPSVAPARSVPLFRRWRDIASSEGALKEGGLRARAAVSRLRTTSPVDMGPQPRDWLHWIALGHWLAGERTAESVPAMSDKSARSSELDDPLVMQALGNYPSVESPQKLAGVMILSGGYPRSGAVWLALAGALIVQGCGAEATVAARWGLSRTVPAQLYRCPPPAWAGLGLALLTEPSGDLQRSVWSWLPGPETRADAWTGFHLALTQLHRHREYVPLLKEAIVRQGEKPADALSLADELERCEWDPEAARVVWQRALHQHPDDQRLLHQMIYRASRRGDLKEARGLNARRVDGEDNGLVLSLLDDAGEQPGKPIPAFRGGDLRDTCARVEAFRLLELKNIGEASHLLETLLQDRAANERAPAVLTLLAGGVERSWVVEESRRYLFNRLTPDASTWNIAAGALVTAAGVPWMEAFLKEGAARWPERGEIPLARAIWLSRRGHFSASLSLLKQLEESRSFVGDVAGWAEVLARPLWRQALGMPVEAGVDGLLQRPWHPPHPQARAFADAVSRRDMTEVGKFFCRAYELHGAERSTAVGALAYQIWTQDRAAVLRWTARCRAGARWMSRDIGTLQEINELLRFRPSR